MTTTPPANFNSNHMGYSMDNANKSAYHRPAQANDWAELNERLEEAVNSGRLSQSQVNKILAHIAQLHNMNS